jgi:hypothetical protein
MQVIKIFIFLMLSACISSINALEKISIFELLANGQNYKSQNIEIEGFLCFKREGAALYPSIEACKYDLQTMGVGLDLTKDLFIKREINGHMEPVSVTGTIVHDSSTITLDGFNFKIRMQNAKYRVLSDSDFLIVKAKTNKKLIKLLKKFKTAVADKNNEVLSKLMGLELKDFAAGNRLDWILFNSPQSINASLKDAEYRTVDFYRAEEESMFFVCLSSGKTRFSMYSQLPLPGDRQEAICFEVFDNEREWIINPGYFGAW